MRAPVDGASVARHGSAPEENEDAWAVAAPPGGPVVAALADGATESAFARAWACALVEAAVRTGDLRAAHAVAARRHAAHVQTRVGALPWYAAAKAEEGAHAALLVVVLTPEGRYRAEAVGDACLFEVDAAGRRRRAWPLATAEAFSHRPVLLSSAASPPDVSAHEGRLHADEHLLLATDALAAYLLAHPDVPWPPEGRAPEPAVALARGAGLRNDDTTWLRIPPMRSPTP